MGLSALTQAERLELVFFARVYLLHWELPSKTLYLSDRNFKHDYGSVQDYENYLFDLSGLAVDLARIRGGLNHKITLTFRNDPILAVDHLIELNGTYRFCFSTVKIYELRLVESGEIFASDVKELVFRGVCGQPYGITRKSFRVDVQNVMLAKRDRLPLQVVDTAVDADADPDDVGRIRNTVYGTVGHVPCRAVAAGAKDTLTADIDDDDVTITVSGETKIAFPGTGTIQIDDEQITYTGFTANQFTGCTRAANATTAVAHNAGAGVCEVLSEYIYEVAQHPVKALDAVYVDGVRQTAGFTAYTGQTGDELAGYEDRAVLEFTVLPIIKKQIQVDPVDNIVVNETAHQHSTSDATATDSSGALQSSSGVTDPSNVVDGNDATYGVWDGASDEGVYRFSNANLGTLNYVRIRIKFTSANLYGVNLGVMCNSTTTKFTGTTNGHGTSTTVTLTFTAAEGAAWTSDFKLFFVYDPSGQVYRVYEFIDCVFNYGGGDTGSGVASVTKSGTVTLVGNSSADTVIGQLVTVDVDGYQDDGGGTYTGTPAALIERPDHVLKHILVALLGESASDIGASFATSGTSYSTTYKFGFILHEVAREADRLLQELAFQCRSKFLEWKGKFELIYLGSAPAAAKTFTEDDLLDEPVFGYTPEIDIRNRIYAKHSRDYRKSGADAYDGVASTSDATSISNNGERMAEIELSACRDGAMAADWVAWYLLQVKNEWRTIEAMVPWIGKALDAGDTFSLTWDFFNAVAWDPENIEIDPMHERIRLLGQEWPA